MTRGLPIGATLSLEERKDWMRLDWNESPYSPTQKVIQAIRDFAPRVNEYPTIYQNKLRATLANYVGASEADQIGVFSGADGALCSIFMSLPKTIPVVYTVPNYGYLDRFFRNAGLKSHPIFCDTPGEEFYKTILPYRSDEKMVFYASNPQAQLGGFLTFDTFPYLALNYPNVTFIVDETYADFVGGSSIPLAMSDNLIVVRSLSKSHCLAGLRVGYAYARHPATMSDILQYRNLEDVNILAEVAAQAALEDGDNVQQRIDQLCEVRDWTISQLRGAGHIVRDSFANFILLISPKRKEIYDALFKLKILVRLVPDIEGGIRIAIRDMPDMVLFVNVMKALAEKK